MAAQMVNQDVVYLKHLHSHLESKDASTFKEVSAKGIAEDIIPAPNMKDIPDIAYVLLFDGLDQLSDNEANQLFGAVLARRGT